MEIPIEIRRGVFRDVSLGEVLEAERLSQAYNYRSLRAIQQVPFVYQAVSMLGWEPDEVFIRSYSQRNPPYYQGKVLGWHTDGGRTNLATVSFGARAEFGLQRVKHGDRRNWTTQTPNGGERLASYADMEVWTEVRHGDMLIVGPNHEPQWEHAVRALGVGVRYSLVMRRQRQHSTY